MTTTQERPPEFDAAVLRYIPAMGKLANKLDKAGAEDLVADTLEYAFRNWRTFRNEYGNYRGIYTWLMLNLRAKVQNKKRRFKPRLVGLDAARVSAPPRQETIVHAGEVVRKLSRTRGGRMLLRVSIGETLAEVGKRRKISHQTVHNHVEKARAKIMKVAA